MSPTASPFLKVLNDKGLRKSRLRLHLLPLFSAAATPLDVAEILRALRTRGIRVNKTSVYRELTRLVNEDIIHAVAFGDGKQRYELGSLPHHHHLICTECERVEDVRLERDLDQMERRIARSRNFRVSSHLLEFFGLCTHCQ